MRVSRIATLCIGLLAVILGLMFESQNIAFLSGLVLAMAASVNFPVLLLSMFWKGLTTRGAVCGSWPGWSRRCAAGAGPGGVGQRAAQRQGAVPLQQPGAVLHEPGLPQCLGFSVTDSSPVPSLNAAATWRSSSAP
jgi:cation/acetate symporter